MKRTLALLGLIALGAHTALTQAPATKASFDAAAVHVRARSSNPNPAVSGGVLRSGRYDVRNATMVDLIALAYDANPESVVGGPNWLERDRFDVVATAPQGTSPDNVRLMLQGLLADRFALAITRERRDVPGNALTVAAGKHKLKQAAAAGAGCQPQQQTPQPGEIRYQAAECRGTTMEMFAQQLRFMANAYLDRPLTDMTGLTGAWDFDLKWTQRALLAQAGSDGISLPDALERQLGLKIEPRGIPQAVIVVNRVNQRPTENLARVAESLPQGPPAEFDVADVKLSPPDAANAPAMGRLQPGGRVDFQNFPLRLLLELVWDINESELLAAPSWIDDTRVSVIARTSREALGSDPTQLDIDDVRLMLQALLKERFRMKTHVENRPVTAYTLLSDRPKLTKADPANRTTCKNGPAPNARDPRNSNPILSRLVTCLNITMAQFAEELPRMAPGYLRTPVTDETGIDGNYDVTFNFSPVGVAQGGGGSRVSDGGGGQPAPAAAPVSTDPTGAVSLFDALRRQLGLKLEMQKRPLPVLVIDQMERKPTEN